MTRGTDMHHGILLAVVLLSTNQIVFNSSVNDPPLQKSAVVVGQGIQLSCATDFPSNCTKWIFTATGTKKEINVYSKEKGINRNFTRMIVTSLSSGGCTLKIHDVQLDDAGNYECFVIGSNETSLGITSSNLTVIDKRSNCSGNFESRVNEGQEIELKCEVRFKGDWIPKTRWKRNTIHRVEEIVSEDVQTLALTNTGVVSLLKFKANFTLNGSSYTYETFILQNIGDEEIKVLDNIKQTWTSPTLNVLYGVKNIQVYRIDNGTQNSAQIFCVGDQLECSADANPSPSYEWTDESGVFRIHGNILELLPYTSFLTLMCMANNSISKHRSQSFRVRESCTYGLPTTLGQNYTSIWITIVVSCVTPVALIFLVCIIIRCKKGALQGQNEVRIVREFPNLTEIPPNIESQSIPSDTRSYVSVPNSDDYHQSNPRDGPTNAEQYIYLNMREIDVTSVYTELEMIDKLHPEDQEIGGKNKEQEYANTSDVENYELRKSTNDYYNIRQLISD